ncbi:MAG: beta strand repeat-containing protein [Methylophilaceae bacterium]
MATIIKTAATTNLNTSTVTTDDPDLIIIRNGTDLKVTDTIDGGDGVDEIRIGGVNTRAQAFNFGANLTNIEQIIMGSGEDELVPADTSRTVGHSINAAAVTSNIQYTLNSGANSFIGGTASDTVDGGAGNDTLNGGAGVDSLLGGDGNDIVIIAKGSDHSFAESINGGAGLDQIRFTSTTANDTLNLGLQVSGIESIVIGTGVAAAAVSTGTISLNVNAALVNNGLTITGNAGVNRIDGTRHDDNISGGAGNDVISAGSGNDTIIGGAGADILSGGGGNDTYFYAALAELAVGEKIVDDVGSNDTILFGGAGVLTLNNNISGIESVTIGSLTGVASTIAGGVNATAIANALTINGNNGANTITGTAFNDTITGGIGADNIVSGDGNDVIVVNTATEYATTEKVNGGNGTDELRIAATTAGTVTLAGLTNVENIVIGTGSGAVGTADSTGTTAINVNASKITTGLNVIGNDGVNIITTGAGADTINGGAGNDTINAGSGNDLIIVTNESDIKTIDGGLGVDTVRFSFSVDADTLTTIKGVEAIELTNDGGDHSVDASNVITGLSIKGNDGANTITGTNRADTLLGGDGDDTIIIQSAIAYADGEVIDGGNGNDTLEFASETDGDTLYLGEVSGIENIRLAGSADIGLIASMLTTGANIEGNEGDNAIFATSGADTISAGDGDDIVLGGSGDDLIDGGSGNDTLLGGSGNNTLTGGDGDDTFIIDEGTSLLVDIADNDHLIVYSGATAVLGAGTDGDDTIDFTTSTLDITREAGGKITLDAGLGNDTVFGLEDINILAGDGDDVLVYADTDALNDAIIDGGDGNDTILITAGGSVVLTEINAESIEQVRISELDGDPINAGVSINASAITHAIEMIGSDGDDTLIGGDFGNVLTGGLGNDSLVGGDDLDVFIFNGDAASDTIDGGYGPTGEGDNPPDAVADIISVLATTDFSNATIRNIETINIASGSTVTFNGSQLPDLAAGAHNLWTINGVAGGAAETVVVNLQIGANFESPGIGFTANNTTVIINGNTGNERFNAKDSNINQADVTYQIFGGDGDDFLNGQSGADTISGDAGNDTITGGQPGNTFADSLSGGEGNDSITGGGGNDTMDGGNGNDILVGTSGGDDSMTGGTGDDAFFFQSPDSNSAVVLNAADTIDGGDGIDSLRVFTGVNGVTSAWVINDNNVTNIEIVEVRQANGNNASSFARVNIDTSNVTKGLDIRGHSGVNHLTGTGFDDIISSGAGTDTIIGGAGNDTLIGGNGNDSLTGGSGDDSFIFDTAAAGTNVDTITDFVSGDDILSFKDSIFNLGVNEGTGGASPTAFTAGILDTATTGITAGNQLAGADARFGFNTTTGQLFYDADGSGVASSAVLVATLTGVTAIAESDLFFIA